MIEETCDVEFDETNGSQGEVFACDDVGDEPLREVMKNIAIGQVKPKEEEEIITPSTQDARMTPKKKLHQQSTMMSHPMKKMKLHNLLLLLKMSKMSKWFKNNFHLMTPTSQVNKPKLKLKMSNH